MELNAKYLCIESKLKVNEDIEGKYIEILFEMKKDILKYKLLIPV